MKNKNLLIKRISRVVGIATILISVVLAFLFYLNIKDEKTLSSFIDMLMNWTIVMVVLAIAFAFLIGPIVSIISNPKSLIKGLISIGVIIVVVVIAYTLSSGDVTTVHLNYEVKNLQSQLMFTETGLITFYIMGAVTVLAIIVAEVMSLFKL